MEQSKQTNQAAATKKLSVILDTNLHARAKRYALVNDMTLTELVISLLEERLQQSGASA